MPPCWAAAHHPAAEGRDEHRQLRGIHGLAEGRRGPHVDEQEGGADAPPGSQGVERLLVKDRGELTRQVAGEVEPRRRLAHRALQEGTSLLRNHHEGECGRYDHDHPHRIGLRAEQPHELGQVRPALAGRHGVAREHETEEADGVEPRHVDLEPGAVIDRGGRHRDGDHPGDRKGREQAARDVEDPVPVHDVAEDQHHVDGRRRHGQDLDRLAPGREPRLGPADEAEQREGQAGGRHLMARHRVGDPQAIGRNDDREKEQTRCHDAHEAGPAQGQDLGLLDEPPGRIVGFVPFRGSCGGRRRLDAGARELGAGAREHGGDVSRRR